MVAENEKLFYTREETAEFQALLEKKLAEARREYQSVRESLRSVVEMSGDAYNYVEFGSDLVDRENNEMMLMRMAKYIDSLERALLRIRTGTYGRCKETGKLIPKERLRVVPHTESAIEVKLNRPK
jgi:RNA polymerase-binding transcription factor DksA